MPKIDRLTKRLLMIYGQGRVAGGNEQFQIYGANTDYIEFAQAYAGTIINGDTFKVHGEIGTDWCEMVEVAWWMNQDRDGNTYFVGHPNTGVLLKPSWREMKWIASFHAKFPDSKMSTEELMAWSLMVGGDWYDQLTYS